MSVANLVRQGLTAMLVLTAATSSAVTTDFEVGGGGIPAQLAFGETTDVSVTVTNLGSESWSSDQGYALAYHWFDAVGQVVQWDGERTAFVEPVAPGASRRLVARVTAPPLPGEYLFQWDVVEEGQRWLSEDDPTPVPRQTVDVVRLHGAELDLGSTPLWLAAGTRIEVPVRVTNTGAFTWPASGPVAVASHWFDWQGEVVHWEGARASMEQVVAPGKTVELMLEVVVPETGGRLRLGLDVVHDQVCWFSEVGGLDRGAEALVVVFPWAGGPPLELILTLVVLLFAGCAVALGDDAALSRVVWLDLAWLVVVLVLKQARALSQMGAPPAIAAWVAMTAGACLVAASLALVGPRWRPYLVWLTGAAATVVVVGDLVYFRFFADLLSAGVLAASHQGLQVADSALSLIDTADLVFLFDLPLALVLVLLVRRATARTGAGRRRVVQSLAGAAVCLGLSSVLAIAVSGEVSLSQTFRHLYGAREVGLFNYHGLDLVRAVEQRLSVATLDPRRQQQAIDLLHQRASLRSGSGPFFAAAEGRNLIMIQVESLQTFALDLSINGEPVMPTLRRWAQEGALFTQVYDQSLEGRSSDAELLSQVSLLPSERGAASFLHQGNSYDGLAEALGEAGYETLSAVPFVGSFWNRRSTHRAFGYSQSLFVDDFTPGENIGWGLNDRDFLQQMAARIELLPEPFCAWLITLSLHHPYRGFPEQYHELDVGRFNGTPFGNYLHTMRYFDSALAAFETRLEATGLSERTLFVLWGDHDAGFEWTDEMAELMNVPGNVGGWVASQRVPLVLRAPGVAELRGESAETAGLLDVPPTVLALLGIDPSQFAYLGRNLLGSDTDGISTMEYRCWADDEHLYVNGGVRLEDGKCLDRLTFERLPIDSCRSGFAAAEEMIEVSQTILAYDLQEVVREALTRP